MNAKKRLSLILLLPALLLTGCFDLGELNGSAEDDYSKYYDAFEDVEALIYDDTDPYTTLKYVIKDSLFNNDTVNSFKWEEGKEVSEEEYLYIIIQPKEDIKLDELILYFYTEENSDMSISCFYVEDQASRYEKPRFRNSPEADDYDDPNIEQTKVLSVYDTTLSVTSKKWTGMNIRKFNLPMAADSCLYLRINNNSGYYSTLFPVRFSFIDLVMRAV